MKGGHTHGKSRANLATVVTGSPLVIVLLSSLSMLPFFHQFVFFLCHFFLFDIRPPLLATLMPLFIHNDFCTIELIRPSIALKKTVFFMSHTIEAKKKKREKEMNDMPRERGKKENARNFTRTRRSRRFANQNARNFSFFLQHISLV